MLKAVFGFAEHQEEATYGLGYELTLTKIIDNSVLKKANAINVGTIKNDNIEWYVPHYTPSISNQAIISKQILSNPPTEIQYIERRVFMEEVNTQKLWTFKLRTHEGINVLIRIIVGFQQRIEKFRINLTMVPFIDLQ